MLELPLTIPQNLADENRRRHSRRSYTHDPLTGMGCTGPRHPFRAADGSTIYLPDSIVDDPRYSEAIASPGVMEQLRLSHDFEYWAATCCSIRDKSTGRIIPFTLNAPQRQLLAALEKQRRENAPIRSIILKARQWGGSTLVQMYMAWIQCTVRRGWNSLICAHVKDTAASIRGIYSTMLARYPLDRWDGDEGSKPAFRPFEGSANIREITGRDCHVTIGSGESAEAVRGSDYAMAHLSEVAFWAQSPRRSPDSLVRSVCGAINHAPMTLIVMESTANGTGNFFHSEWCRSVKGESDKTPVFIPWHQIEIYSTPLPAGADPDDIFRSFDAYERNLWYNNGLTLEQIYWYHLKRREYREHAMMKAEYPSTPTEAFSCTDNAVFNPDDIERLRLNCSKAPLRGEIIGIPRGSNPLDNFRFSPRPDGEMAVWKQPDTTAPHRENRYIVTVDIGGRSSKSDYSVIAVFDRTPPGDTASLELVAQWRGHCDHDLLAWRAAAIARHYNNALLAFESNTLDSDNTEGDPADFILNTLDRYYDNLYRRPGGRLGFHTNRASKSAIIAALQSALRDSTFIEHDHDCCNELLSFRNNPDGTQSAPDNAHDDIIITRGIAVHLNNEIGFPAPSTVTPEVVEFLTRR